MITDIKHQYTYIRESIKAKNLTRILVWTHNLMGSYAFYRLGKRMAASSSGRQIIRKMPRVTKDRILSYNLHLLPSNSFGNQFICFMRENGFDQEIVPPPLLPFENVLTSYAKIRWRETHDYRHILTGFSASLADEAIIAAFQFGNIHNLWSFLVMIIAPFLSWKQLNPFKQWYRMIEACKAGQDAVCLGSVDYEGEFETPINQLRIKWKIKDLSHLSSEHS